MPRPHAVPLGAIAVVAALALPACAQVSEEEIKREFEAFVTARNQCREAADCVLATAGCPLGCTAPVAREHQAAVEAKARELIRRYERSGRACMYGCIEQAPPMCQDGRCVSGPRQP
jgi:hypothetical protein